MTLLSLLAVILVAESDRVWDLGLVRLELMKCDEATLRAQGLRYQRY